MYTNFHSIFVYNSSKLETTHMPINKYEWINKLWYMHQTEYYSTIKNILIQTTKQMNPNILAELHKPVSK